MAEHQWSITNCRNHKQTSDRDESQSTEPGEKQTKRITKNNSIRRERPNFHHDSDRPVEIQSDDSQRDIPRWVMTTTPGWVSKNQIILDHVKSSTINPANRVMYTWRTDPAFIKLTVSQIRFFTLNFYWQHSVHHSFLHLIENIYIRHEITTQMTGPSKNTHSYNSHTEVSDELPLTECFILLHYQRTVFLFDTVKLLGHNV